MLHEAEAQGLLNTPPTEHSSGVPVEDLFNSGTLLLVQKVPTAHGEIVSFFDSGSTISLVSRSFVKRKNLHGVRVSYDLVTVGGVHQPQSTYLHEITLKDNNGNEHVIQAFQIDEICGRLRDVDVSRVVNCFNGLSKEDVERPEGPIELLIGMKHATVHPKPIKKARGLVLYESIFGTTRVLGGCHPLLVAGDQLNNFLEFAAAEKVVNPRVASIDPGMDFFSSEDFGVRLPPRCDRCKGCRNCTKEVHQLSREEMRELTVIKENLVLNPLEEKWTTMYPYKCDVSILDDNRQQAIDILRKTEERVLRSEITSRQYIEQFDDFIRRGVFREICEEEMRAYSGPVFYVTHHEVYKEGSTSTPMRLVINSSLKFKGRSLNDILMKGPNILNDIFGVQLRFCSYIVPLVGDMTKMYHSVLTTELERHLRRVVWRRLDKSENFKTYGTETVMFGDRPAGAIASTAVKKTADIYEHIDPIAAKRIINDSYVDDIATGAETREAANTLKNGIEAILKKGGFKIKGFVTSGDVTEEELSLLGSGEVGRVLGIGWDPRKDEFKVRVRINVSKKYRSARVGKDLSYDEIPSLVRMKLTRRMLLSIVNSCYDPYGLLSPITIQMKIALRRMYSKELNIGWDDELPREIKEQWVRVLSRVKEAEKVSFKRCVKPENSVGQPDLVICNNGSELAMCSATYVRWECTEGDVDCRLWAAKTRVTPLQKLTIPRIEMQSAVMGVRLAESIKKNSIWAFRSVYHMTDSKCLLATLSKDTGALGEFSGNLVTEILLTTTTEQWFHIKSKDNIADLGTRENASATDIDEKSQWQRGPSWMYLPIGEWPIDQDVKRSTIPDEFVVRSKMVTALTIEEPAIDYEKLKGRTYEFARNVTAICIKILRRKSFRIKEITVEDVRNAESYMISISMKRTREMLAKGMLLSLRPVETEDGIIQLGCRAMEGLYRNFMKMMYFQYSCIMIQSRTCG